MTQPVTFDVNPMLKKVDMIKQVQIPFASSLALNNLAKEVRDNYRSEMKQRFRNPVPFTLNGMYIKASTKSNLYVEVGLKEFAPKGNPSSKYLLPQIQGGKPYMTRFQKALEHKGILAPGEIAIPTQSDYLRRNQYGNVMPSQYTEILYSLQAFRDSSAFTYRRQAKRVRAARQYKARTTAAFRNDRGGRYFPGIYLEDEMARQTIDSALFWITRKRDLRPKFPFIPLGAAYAQNNWNRNFGQALAKAIATA
jgi:hypothetical protein|tara:strand:+ start:1215 stop:1970 length:756 start_codon:yes stop_codon:yes gene_type:complete